MDDLKPMPVPSNAQLAEAVALDLEPSAEGLAKRFFVLTMIGVVVYISAIVLLLSSGS